MQFSDQELRDLSGFLNKMVLPTNLVVIAENLKSYFGALDSVATPTVEEVVEVPEATHTREEVVEMVGEEAVAKIEDEALPVEVVSE